MREARAAFFLGAGADVEDHVDGHNRYGVVAREDYAHAVLERVFFDGNHRLSSLQYRAEQNQNHEKISHIVFPLRRMACANLSAGRVLMTSSGPSQPLRAVMTPYHMFCRCLGWWASVEIVNLAPRDLAVRARLPLRSSRSGLELISRNTFRFTASVTTRSKSNGNDSRCISIRPVGCPSTLMCGHSRARSSRSVISAGSRFMWLCTLPMTRSSSANASSARS